jgi:hypothetical protein
MMKQNYIKPATRVVKLQHQNMVCVSLTNVNSGDAGLDYNGGGSGPARSRHHSVWDDDWDEE